MMEHVGEVIHHADVTAACVCVCVCVCVCGACL